jgi:hypothetical protein
LTYKCRICQKEVETYNGGMQHLDKMHHELFDKIFKDYMEYRRLPIK